MRAQIIGSLIYGGRFIAYFPQVPDRKPNIGKSFGNANDGTPPELEKEMISINQTLQQYAPILLDRGAQVDHVGFSADRGREVAQGPDLSAGTEQPCRAVGRVQWRDAPRMTGGSMWPSERQLDKGIGKAIMKFKLVSASARPLIGPQTRAHGSVRTDLRGAACC